MPNNRGTTTLKCKRHRCNPMAEYDRLPQELRLWVAGAILPWRAGSVKAAYDKALSRHGNPQRALQDLDRVQAALVARDAGAVWGKHHPSATGSG